jgi:hypothetical protein
VTLAAGLLLFTVLALVVLVGGDVVEDDGEPTTVLLSGQAEVPRGQIHDDVLVLRGSVVVGGTVEDDVLVVDGRVRVDGVVHGDVTVLRGDAVLTRNAEVGGDLNTSGPSRVARGAEVSGSIGDAGPLDAAGSLPFGVRFGAWLAAGLTVLAIALSVPGPLQGAAGAGVGRPGRSILVGTGLLVLAPLVLGVLALSLIGSVLALVLGAGLVVAVAAGATVSAGAVGRLLVRRDGRGALLTGWAVLGAAFAVLTALSPLLALLAAGGVVAFGLGALVPARPQVPRPPVEDDHDHQDDVADDDPPPDSEPVPEVVEAPADDEPRILAAFPIAAGPAAPN